MTTPLNSKDYAKAWTDYVADKEDNPFDPCIAPVLRDVIGDIGGKDVLELACGSGRSTKFLLDLGGKVTAVDSNAELLTKAEKDLKKAVKAGNLTLHLHDVNNRFGRRRECYDLVAAIGLVHLLPDKGVNQIVAFAHDLLREGGRIVFELPHPELWRKRYTDMPASPNGVPVEFEFRGLKVQGYYRRLEWYLRLVRDLGFELDVPASRSIRVPDQDTPFWAVFGATKA